MFIHLRDNYGPQWVINHREPTDFEPGPLILLRVIGVQTSLPAQEQFYSTAWPYNYGSEPLVSAVLEVIKGSNRALSPERSPRLFQVKSLETS